MILSVLIALVAAVVALAVLGLLAAVVRQERSAWQSQFKEGRRSTWALFGAACGLQEAQERACVAISPGPLNILVPMRPHFSHL